MVDGRPIDNQDRQQALQDLVSSPGWLIFAEEARQIHGPDRIVGDLLGLARETTDLESLGALTASRLSVLHAVEQLLAWPEAILSQYRTAAGERE